MFDFLTNLTSTFKVANIEQKRVILTAFAKKITLKDTKLNIEPFEWFEAIKKNDMGINLKNPTFELQQIMKMNLKKDENEQFEQLSSRWLAIINDIRTEIYRI